MYEDEDFWPIKCPDCGKEFVEQIGRMKTGEQSRCPVCGHNLWHPTEQLKIALAEAKAGRLDPWGDMFSLKKPT